MTQAVVIAQSGSNNTTFRNRIINGAMMIDQRNNGASVSIGTGYPVDRFLFSSNTSSFTAQQSTTAPAGFKNSCVITVTSSATPSAGDYRQIIHSIEGNNVADFDLGKSSAITFTLSFWVRSSVTGTFSAGLMNSATNRSYVFTYAINAANTWEYKTITVAGDTSGTWLTDNGVGLQLRMDLGSGSTYTTSAGSWQAGIFFKATGSTNLVATNGATFYITGVQLEKGTVATPFEQRLYSTEFTLCQRYYEQQNMVANAAGQSYQNGFYLVQKRVAPTIAVISGSVSPATLNSRNVNYFTIDGLAASNQVVAISASAEL